MENDDVRDQVRSRYAEIARDAAPCSAGGACSAADPAASARLGYSAEEMAAVPDGANLGLGCSNPQAIAQLRPGETVLDLGSGGGFDCILAARQVGPSGSVLGVDMTPGMVARARANARKLALPNVQFRLGEIEHLPVPDASGDVIISNCVINLSPDKRSVFHEAFRALRPGGRLALNDVVATAPLPDEERKSMALYTGCVAGAASTSDLRALAHEAGFVDVRITPVEASRAMIEDWVAGDAVAAKVISASIQARRPAPGEATTGCCGGDAPAGADTCCALDAEVKATGGAGCGCGPAAPREKGCC